MRCVEYRLRIVLSTDAAAPEGDGARAMQAARCRGVSVYSPTDDTTVSPPPFDSVGSVRNPGHQLLDPPLRHRQILVKFGVNELVASVDGASDGHHSLLVLCH